MTDSIRLDICVATFRRCEMLLDLLNSIDGLYVPNDWSVRVIVVDNDSEASAKATVHTFSSNARFETLYVLEPIQNISRARNAALREANGDFIAFVDDDERLDVDWLVAHASTIFKYRADVTFGPVEPVYPPDTPHWVLDGMFFSRPARPTGSVRTHGATNNTFVRRATVCKMGIWFDEAYGLTGGGDTDFFKRMCGKGGSLVWCNEAVVFEDVPQQRMTMKWLLLRALRSGQNYARVYRHEILSNGTAQWVLRRVAGIALGIFGSAFGLIFGKAYCVHKWRLAMRNIGQLLAFTSWQYEEYRHR